MVSLSHRRKKKFAAAVQALCKLKIFQILPLGEISNNPAPNCHNSDQKAFFFVLQVSKGFLLQARSNPCHNSDQSDFFCCHKYKNNLPKFWSNPFSVDTNIKPLASSLIKFLFCCHNYQTTCHNFDQTLFLLPQISNHLPEVWSNTFSFCHKCQTTCHKSDWILFSFCKLLPDLK